MKIRTLLPILFFGVFILFGCGHGVVPSPSLPRPTPTTTVHSVDYSNLGLSYSEIKTLLSLEQIDDYPLYKMNYYADYSTASLDLVFQVGEIEISDRVWGCSVFAALGDPENRLYGRNFDWEFSPTLLLFTDPSDGYASVSMVDLVFLGFRGEAANRLTEKPLDILQSLLASPRFSFDGMNEMGLVVGMAAVPPGNMKTDPNKPTIGSLVIIREMLDHATRVDEAVDIMASFNIDFYGGPAIHYLIADRFGEAVMVEYYSGEMHVIKNQQPWHLATNFLLSIADLSGEGYCDRYDSLNNHLITRGGMLTPQDAMDLLEVVSVNSTQWSIVYNVSSGEIQVVMGREYNQAYKLQFDMAEL